MREKRFLHFHSHQWPRPLCKICSPDYSCPALFFHWTREVSTAFLFWKIGNRRHRTDRQTDGMQYLMRPPPK